MPGTMYPGDTVVNLKHSFPCEAYVLMRETNSNKINRELTRIIIHCDNR